jgi:uncharacterized protein
MAKNYSFYGPLELLILQGSPFCNINCSYCYLPNRSDNSKLSLETVDVLFKKLFNTDIVRQDFTLCWHAGEPLTVSKEFYRQAISIANRHNNTKYLIRNNLQTNATLITQEWCDFFQELNFKVSVSIDGPEFIHDMHRITRNGKGTFKSAMKGLELLKKNNIEFSVISVLTDFTLDYPKEFYNFFKELNPLSVGLNIEEIENVNTISSLFISTHILERYKNFIDKLFYLSYTDEKAKFFFREFAQLEKLVFTKDKFMNGFGQQTIPFRILAVDVNGSFATFSPELLSAKAKEYSDFTLGNIFSDNLLDTLKTEKFKSIYSEILFGIRKCKQECDYFSVCGGGTPSNKYSENGSFNSTMTNHCRFRFQALFDVFFENLESEIVTQEFSFPHSIRKQV